MILSLNFFERPQVYEWAFLRENETKNIFFAQTLKQFQIKFLYQMKKKQVLQAYNRQNLTKKT